MVVNEAVKYNQGINPGGEPAHYILDFRSVALTPKGSKMISGCLFRRLKELKCRNIAGLRLGAVPLVSLLVMEGVRQNYPINGVIVRKRPKNGSYIEGKLNKGESFIVVDDLINSGSTIKSVAGKLKEAGCRADSALVLADLDRGGAKRLKAEGIRVDAIFDARDIFLKNRREKTKRAAIAWKIGNTRPLAASMPRSSPVSHKNSIFFGTTEGKLYKVSAEDGSQKWSYTIDRPEKNPKGIMASPCVYQGMVYFGGYDGNLVCLDALTGRIVWKRQRGDWIGSSCCIAGGILCVGAEYAPRKGVLIACKPKNGKMLWHYKTDDFIHSSPTIDAANRVSAVGCNNGLVFGVDLDSGDYLWHCYTGRPMRAGFAVDKGHLYFGSENGVFYCIRSRSGQIVWKRKIADRIYNTPEIVDGKVILGTVSKRIFVLDKKSGEILWYHNTNESIFSFTRTTGDKIYCGSGDYLYILSVDNKHAQKLDIGDEAMSRPLIMGKKAFINCRNSFICAITIP
jgi:outer membrane protein assembly factor BamB/orotate phosphoribosyltransferase